MNKIKLKVKTKSKTYPIIIGKNIINQVPNILKSNNINVINKIDNLGIKKIVINSDTIIQVEKYLVVNFKNDFKPYEKMKMQEVKTKIIDDNIKFGKGDVLIPLNQKKSNLIVELMEPEAPNSFVSFGIMKTNKEDILTVYRINN